MLLGVMGALAVSLQGASAAEPPVALGEVTAQAAARDDLDVDALRTMAADALRSMDASTLPRGAHAVLSVSLVRMESHATTPAEVSCAVSATLRDRSRGAIYAVLEGSARGQDEPQRMRALERATLRAAVSSAIARVPEALRTRRR
jgi:hypothetical protein